MTSGITPRLWRELLVLLQDEAGERLAIERLLELWCQTRETRSAGLYLERQGVLEQQAAVGEHLPEILDAGALERGELAELEIESLRLPGGCLLWSPAGNPFVSPEEADDPLPVLLASALKSFRLKQVLKEQQFQVNYRVVELENLYDVGLAVAGTLDLDRLSEEILLRAMSLLDARRGALYVLEDGRYRLERNFGGEAGRWFAEEDPDLAVFLSGYGEGPADLLPGAHHLLSVPIVFESSPRGMLVVGDKESRRAVGPFSSSDRRTLGLFANQAAIALENARLHLRALEQERLEREMHLAAEIQRQILPKGAPQLPGCQLVGWNRPAREVGGDYYDMFPTQGGRMGLVVGDVSGKGIPAALMVSTLHSALRLLLDQTGIGPPLLEKLNKHILESSMPNKFITMFVAELDPESGNLLYVNAGHNPGLLLHQDGRIEELGSGGVPLGLFPGSRYQAREATVGPGDLLCLYSDGITEAESVDDEELGTERLCDVLRSHCEEPALQAVLDAVRVSVEEFSRGRPQGDDQTLLLLRRDLTP
ncbi:MAG TPA: SpoIIE family protein phosphatase [Thermoanaerobaculia bacterium]|nr:SpoIIE family protein phosphatase [Thermoanaerobaculia bacterium]